jgi:glycerol dehydrogenase
MLDRFLILKRNPDVVLVDSQVIAEAPTRYFVAGMGDALATWFEAFTCTKSGAKNLPGGVTTAAALNLARLCYDTLMEHGVSAKLAVDQDAVTPAVEAVIEANILLSGLGFESSGLAAAHGIHEGVQALEGTEGALHGELVAFGTIAQLVMEDYPREEIDRVIDFCNAVGLPVTLRQLGVADTSPENLMKAAEIACMEGLTTHNSYFEVNPELVLEAITGANALGEASLKHS